MLQIEELSNQNEDLICKLKESMERELVLRYPSSYFSLLLAYLLLCYILLMIFLFIVNMLYLTRLLLPA